MAPGGLRAGGEQVVAGVLKLDESSLKAVPDKSVGLPSRVIILESSGTIETKDDDCPGGRRPVIDGFKSEAEAREWIKTGLIAWIERYEGRLACLSEQFALPMFPYLRAVDAAAAPEHPASSLRRRHDENSVFNVVSFETGKPVRNVSLSWRGAWLDRP
jgi:hypothetical protein